jgi:hypothetical protein
MRRDNVAYHEAGHAVAAVLTGVGFCTSDPAISIVPDPTRGTKDCYSQGRTSLAFTPVFTLIEKLPIVPDEQFLAIKHSEAERFATILLAGEAAQRIHSPRNIRKVHFKGDHEAALHYLSVFADPTAEFERMRNQAKALMIDHWHIVGALAVRVLLSREMSGAEVEDFITELMD